MAFNLATIRTQLASELAALTGWETYATWPDKPEPPCVIVQPGDGEYHLAMQKGAGQVPVQLVILVSSVVTDEAQSTLDAYLSSGTSQTKSVIDTLQGSTLSGNCLQVHVVGWSDYGAVPLGDDTRLFGAVVNLQVFFDRK